MFPAYSVYRRVWMDELGPCVWPGSGKWVGVK